MGDLLVTFEDYLLRNFKTIEGVPFGDKIFLKSLKASKSFCQVRDSNPRPAFDTSKNPD